VVGKISANLSEYGFRNMLLAAYTVIFVLQNADLGQLLKGVVESNFDK
jgi:hypothetical protein